MPLSTLELRWFFEGALKDTRVEAWFRTRVAPGPEDKAGALRWLPEPPAWRADRYLLVPGAEDMGIKWREGQLQMKGRIEARSDQRLADGIAGHVERWVKWSFAGTHVERQFKLWGAGGARTILVEKRRLQRVIRLEPSGAALKGRTAAPGEPALSLELTRIRCRSAGASATGQEGSDGETHWSLGLEVAPADAVAIEDFTTEAARLLEGCPGLLLTAARSLSFPAWLLQFSPNGGASGSR